jgi:hypothetical protein
MLKVISVGLLQPLRPQDLAGGVLAHHSLPRGAGVQQLPQEEGRASRSWLA